MFADLLVETNRRQTALAVPKDAVVDEGGEVVVYLQRGGETFERRRVEVGIRDANQVEIRNGLAAGDRVATKGAYTIRLSTCPARSPPTDTPTRSHAMLTKLIHLSLNNRVLIVLALAGLDGGGAVCHDDHAGGCLPGLHRADGDDPHGSPRHGSHGGRNAGHVSH